MLFIEDHEILCRAVVRAPMRLRQPMPADFVCNAR